MFCAEDVVDIYQHLRNNNIPIWLTGGWGIDALLGEQTRPHKDLDVFVLLDDILRMCTLLEQDGYTLKELWEENCPAVDTFGNRTDTAFVLQDPQGRELDIHAMRLDEAGNGLPVWRESEGFIIKKQDLAREGSIARFSVQCISPEMQMICHTGYEVPEKQLHDLELLHDKFGVETPWHRNKL